MKIRRIRPEFTLLALLLWAPGFVYPVAAEESTNAGDSSSALADQYIIVKYRSNVALSQRRDVRQAWAATLVDSLSLIGAELWLDTTADPKNTAARIAADPRVLYAEPNYLWQADRIPNDPLFSLQWGLHNIGQTDGSPDADIDAAEAWDRSTGQPIVMGIIDSGIDSAHADLVANIWTNPFEIPGNGIDDDSNGYIDDVHGWDFVDNDPNPHDESVFPNGSVLGHGTHVAGIVGAVGNNGVGIAGVHWNAELIPLRFLNRSGFGSTVAGIKALEYAVRAGARLTCNSWGGAPYSQALYDAITASADAGMIFVAAAGNDRNNTDITPHYPSSYDHDAIISVAATTHQDRIADEALWGTNFGLTSVDLGAPGVSIYSTIPPSDYGYLSGTSMAAPHVAGAVGMIWSEHPHLSVEQVKVRLLATTDRLPDLAGKTVSGGRLNLDRALADYDVVPPSPVADLTVVLTEGTRVTLAFTATGDDGATGTAFRYDVRFATSPIDSINWDLATPFATGQVPATSGARDTIRVTDLPYGTPYYFAVVVEDEWFNGSPVSNGVTTTTTGPPVARLSRDSLNWQLSSGDSLVQEVVLANLGPGELFFEAGTDYAFNRAPAASAASVTQPDTLDVMLVYADNSALGLKAILESFEDVGRVDTWFAGLTGGTIPRLRDISDYDVVIAWNNKIWADAFEIGALLADYIDSGGAVVTAVDAWGSGLFSSHGRYFQQDGYSPFRSTGDALFLVRTLGWFNSEHPVMTGVLDLAIGSYHNQVALTPGATIIARWNDGMPLVAAQPHTVAINIWPGDGYHWLGDFPRLLHNAIHYAAGHNFWLNVRPQSGEVSPGDSVTLQVAVDAAKLDGGSYNGFLHVQTSDPVQSTLELDALLQVTGTARLEFDTDVVEFDESYVGFPRRVPLIVANTGSDSLFAGPFSFDLPHFSSPSTQLGVAPGEEDTLWVTFTPPAIGEVWGTVQFVTNDPDWPSVRRVLHAITSEPPVTLATPGSVSADLFSGGRLQSVASLRNTGSGELRFHTVFRGSAPPARTEVFESATSATLPLQTSDTVAILAWSRYADLSPGQEFVRVQEALNGYARDFKLDVTGTADPAELETLLFDRHLFLVLEQENAQSDIQNIGTAFSPVLNDFVLRGGTVVFLQEWDNANGFMIATGLLDASVVDRGFDMPLRVADSGHALLQSVSDTIVGANLTAWYQVESPDARLVVTDSTGAYAVVAERVFGAGRVILMGFDFFTYNADMAWMLANAVSLARQNFSWVSALPASGTIPSGEQQSLALTFRAAGLPGGDYHAEVIFETNDPAVPRHTVFAHLTVTDAPHVQLDSDTLAFGIVFLDSDVELPLRMVNGGTLPLVVDSISDSGSPFVVDPSGFTLQPGESMVRMVHFSPQVAGLTATLLNIHSNDPDASLQPVAVTAFVQAAPRLRLDRDSGVVEVMVGGSTDHVVTVRNSGGSVLQWTLDVDYAPGDSTALELPWSFGAFLPEGRSQAGLVVVPGGDLYSFGGWGEGNALNPSLWRYDLGLKEWLEQAAMPIADRGMATATDRQGRIYAFSSVADSSYRYDPGTDAWTAIADPPVKRTWEAAAARGVDGRIYLFGGEHGSPETPLDLVQIYHPEQDYWTVGAPMPTPRYGHAVVAGAGGRMYVMGGRADFQGEPLDVVEIYDPARDRWYPAAPMPTARSQFAVALGKDEKIYALGGKTQYLHGAGPFLDVVEVYDPRADAWLAGPSLPGARGECEAVTSGGYIRVVGGTDSTHLADQLLLATPRWLHPSVVAGALSPGDSALLTLPVSATGLAAGMHQARLVFRSNDPVTPDVSYHVVADVQTAPDLLLYSDSVIFSEVRLGDSSLASICISNRGDGILHIDATSSLSEVFTPAKALWTLSPGADSMFELTFLPAAAGNYAATLSLQTNDPDQPAGEIVLLATAKEPPEVSVSADSLVFRVTAAADSSAPVVIANAGSGDLVWRLEGITAAPPGVQDVRRVPSTTPASASQSPLPWSDLRRLDSVRIAITDPRFVPVYATIHEELAGRGALTRNMGRPFSVLRLDSIDVLVLDDYATSLFADDRAGIRSWVQGGGRLLLQNRGINSLEEVNDILVGTGIQQYGQSRTSGSFDRLATHPVTLGVDSIFATSFALFCQWEEPAIAVVQDEFGRGIVVVARVGSGRLAVTSAELMADYNLANADTRLFVHRLVDWLARGTTVAASPMSGLLPPGTSQEVTVQTAGRHVAGGLYNERLIVATNDPLRNRIEVPVRVEMEGLAQIGVSADTVDFGPSFIGYGTTRDLAVENTGTATLSIQNIVPSVAQFNAAKTTFDIPVFDEISVAMTMVPDAEGILTGTLTITSNAAHEPALVLPMRGTGLWPPQVEAPVDSLQASVFAGFSLQQIVTVANTGRSDLTFTLDLLPDPFNPLPLLPLATSPRSVARVMPQPLPVSVQRGTVAEKGGLLATTARMALEYQGDFMRFGVTDFGEVFPFVYPEPISQMWGSGYTVVYRANNADQIKTVYFFIEQIVQDSLVQVRADSQEVVVRYFGHTDDGRMGVDRTVYFERNRKYVAVDTRLSNLTSETLEDVVFKSLCDWDLDGSFGNDNWNYDTLRNMAYGYDQKWAGLAAREQPDFMDFNGRNDYFWRNTTIDYPTGPVLRYDGMLVLHFELGDLTPGAGTSVHTVYAMGDSLSDLQRQVDRGLQRVKWLDADIQSAVVPQDSSLSVTFLYDAVDLVAGEYRALVRLASNDPANPELTWPVHLHVDGSPSIAVDSDSLQLDTVYLGYPVIYPLTISNRGSDSLRLESVTSLHPSVTTDWSTAVLGPGADTVLWVTVAPVDTGFISTRIVMTSDDSIRGELYVVVEGFAALAPALRLPSDTLYLTLGAGDSSATSITIANDGPGILRWAFPELQAPASVRSNVEAAPGSVPLADYIRAEPASGSLAPGTAIDATLVVSAVTLDPGDLVAELVFAHNDPARDSVRVHLALLIFEIRRGDANADNRVDARDIVYLVNTLWKAGPDPVASGGDMNCDFSITLQDIMTLINYVFKGAPAPDCTP